MARRTLQTARVRVRLQGAGHPSCGPPRAMVYPSDDLLIRARLALRAAKELTERVRKTHDRSLETRERGEAPADGLERAPPNASGTRNERS